MPRQSPNPYLTANFAPLPAEVTALRLPVEGEVPEAVRGGTLLRIGPNPVLVEDPASYHWFVGDGMVHSFQFSETGSTATVDHRSRWVRTDSAAEDLGEEPIADQPAEVGPGNEANTNIVVHGGRILALLEVALPTEIRRDASTVGRYDFAGELRSAMTAHPKIDPTTQELAFFGMSLDGTLRYHVVEPFGALVTTQEIPIPRAVMMHDFAITATQAVFLDLPVVYFAERAEGRPFPAAWAPEHGARVGVMPRHGGEATWIDIEPCYVFHTINAVDGDGGTVVIDVVRYPTMFDTDVYGIGGTPARLERWTIDPAAGTVGQEILDDRPQEFPAPTHDAWEPTNDSPTPRRSPSTSTLLSSAPCSVTTSPAAPSPKPGSPTAPKPAKGSSYRPATTPPRTTAGCSPRSTGPSPTPATSSCSPPRTTPAARSPPSTSHSASPSASTAAGCQQADGRAPTPDSSREHPPSSRKDRTSAWGGIQ